jgi:hypothetical protein
MCCHLNHATAPATGPVAESRHRRARFQILAWAASLLVLGLPPQALAQVGGVYIDAEGMLKQSAVLRPIELKKLLEAEGAPAAVPVDIARPSALRRVSLARLEQIVERAHQLGEPLPAEVRYLAGLQGISYLRFLPEQADVLLCGPAEAWEQLPSGDVVGVRSRLPVLHLDDLIVALRYAFARDRADAFIGCSIEPAEEGVKELSNYLGRLKGIDGAAAPRIAKEMEQTIGPQQILVYGVPAGSRFALKMVSADYRLKRIALGHDASPSKKVPSYLELMARAQPTATPPQQRWWFVGRFDALRHSADKLTWQLEGNGLAVQTGPSTVVALAAADQSKPSRAATQFAQAATRGFEELAGKVPVFADLRNLVALATTAVMMREMTREYASAAAPGQAAGNADQPPSDRWPLFTHFLSIERCPIARFEAPRKAPALSVVRQISKRHWLFAVSGGVEIDPEVLAEPRLHKQDASGRLDRAQGELGLTPDRTRWWWD